MDFEQLKDDIAAWAAELGFQEIGVTDIDLSAEAPRVRDWLARGFQGEMGYLERNLDKRLMPEHLVPGTVRVISARMDYLPAGTRPLEVLERRELGYVSRYALGRDYHKVLRRRLARLGNRISAEAAAIDHRFRAFTDSAPVLEKALGSKAGLGWIGKHTLLLSRHAGSWFFLGEIYTNLPLPVDEAGPDPGARPAESDPCGACRACMTVCPTGAIVGPRELDARRCISYLTIEHRGPIPESLREAMGNRIYGCDDCQLYCPWNRFAQPTPEPDFTPRHGLEAAGLVSLFCWSEAEFLEKTEGSAIRRITYEQWQRNLAVALGNGPATAAAVDALASRRPSASPMLREHIDWALTRLQNVPANPPSHPPAG